MNGWEYKLIQTPNWDEMGAAGWEFVTLNAVGEHIFKRPAPSAVERFTIEQSAAALKNSGLAVDMPQLLNPDLAALARSIGHTQMLLICDREFPVPGKLPMGTINLALSADVPTVPQVLNAVLTELPHDRIVLSQELQKSADRWAWHKAQRIPLESHPHVDFRQLAKEAVACIRTGDSTAYGAAMIVGGDHEIKAHASGTKRITQTHRRSTIIRRQSLLAMAREKESPRLLHPKLASLVRKIGHTQMLIVCDRGFPVPPNLPLGVIDLSVTSDVPTVTQVLSAILPSLPHDRIIGAQEMEKCSPARWTWHTQRRAAFESHPHAHLKQIAREAVACVRTGDSTAYGNVIVVGG